MSRASWSPPKRRLNDPSIFSSSTQSPFKRLRTGRTSFRNHDDGSKELRFACPFFKHDPQRHRHTACRYPGFSGVFRVKEHLYRSHYLIQCKRCRQVFEKEADLDEHLRSIDACPVNYTVGVEGIDAAQKARLKSRKKFGSETSESEKWMAVYHYLFPEDDLASLTSYCDFDITPAIGGGDMFGFEEFAKRELPLRVNAELEHNGGAGEPLIGNESKSKLMHIIRSCQDSLFLDFHRLNAPEHSQGEERHSTSPRPTNMELCLADTASITPPLIPGQSVFQREASVIPSLRSEGSFSIYENSSQPDTPYDPLDDHTLSLFPVEPLVINSQRAHVPAAEGASQGTFDWDYVDYDRSLEGNEHGVGLVVSQPKPSGLEPISPICQLQPLDSHCSGHLVDEQRYYDHTSWDSYWPFVHSMT